MLLDFLFFVLYSYCLIKKKIFMSIFGHNHLSKTCLSFNRHGNFIINHFRFDRIILIRLILADLPSSVIRRDTGLPGGIRGSWLLPA